ncbi:MAG: tryptophan synthase subunit alpha [Cyclobacteriaceae bacterium]|nr:tryptophan synthase subunit alpha [Cyclobacteriaceae bacterium HetDA_MAG_MS6]
MNRIDQAFQDKKQDLLNVYFTAGYPELEDTIRIAKSLDEAGADVIEIGIPFSDPIADGPTIQDSSQKALNNGMTLAILLDQLKDLRSQVTVPVLLMGYLNPIIQFGMEKFCAKCKEVGIDGLILPDLPMHEYIDVYKTLFDKYELHNIFLITPQTSEKRIREIDQYSRGFIYTVSSASTTGARASISEGQEDYFKRIRDMKLKRPIMIGFGISNHDTFQAACQYADGAIIGSAFIKVLDNDSTAMSIKKFVTSVKVK